MNEKLGLANFPEYLELLEQNLAEFKKNYYTNEQRYTDEYALMFPMVGKNYFDNPELLVFGRALNGWEKEGYFDFSSDNKNVIKGTIGVSTNYNPCSMSFVNNNWDIPTQYGYLFRRSSFWQVICKTMMQKFGKTNEDWTYNLAWSNLYKICPPYEGNPSEYLAGCQFEVSKKIILKEIELLKPKNVLFITGWNWVNEFFKDDNILKKESNKYVCGSGNYSSSNLIVSIRPEMQNRQDFVDEVAKYLLK